MEPSWPTVGSPSADGALKMASPRKSRKTSVISRYDTHMLRSTASFTFFKTIEPVEWILDSTVTMRIVCYCKRKDYDKKHARPTLSSRSKSKLIVVPKKGSLQTKKMQLSPQPWCGLQAFPESANLFLLFVCSSVYLFVGLQSLCCHFHESSKFSLPAFYYYFKTWYFCYVKWKEITTGCSEQKLF